MSRSKTLPTLSQRARCVRPHLFISLAVGLCALWLAACGPQPAPSSPVASPVVDAPDASVPEADPTAQITATLDGEPVVAVMTPPTPTAEIAPTAAPAVQLPTPTPGSVVDAEATAPTEAEVGSETESNAGSEDAPPRAGVAKAALANVRSAPALDGEILTLIEAGDRFEILDASDDGGWLQICCVADGDEVGWISAELVDEFATPPAETAAQPTLSVDGEPIGLVSAALVNVRGGPGTSYNVIGSVNEGGQVRLTGRNEDGSWLQFCCANGRGDGEPGWISADFVDITGAGQAANALPVAEAPALPEPVAVAATAGGDQAAQLAAAPAPGLPGPGGFGSPGGTNPLTGLPLDGSRTGQRPLIVCINNDYAARPQFGISQADVMYEYLMEGFGITRFSGVFYGDNVGQIGPVRSARLINYYMAPLFGAGLACSGASDRVRFALKHEMPAPYMDIDLDDPSNTRYSVSIGGDYRTRLRTSTDGLRRWLAAWGVEQPAAIRGFSFGGAPEGGAPATTISIPYPRATGSQVSYQYDGGRYLRSLGGASHLDGNSGAQVGVENVVVQYVPHEITDIVEDSLGSRSIRLNLFGSGRAIVFRDGQAHAGVWRSDSQGDMPRFYTDAGVEIPLKPGRTWISVVPLDYGIQYQ